MVREAAADGMTQAVVCGLPATMPLSETHLEIEPENIFPVFFESPELPFPVAGMSDVMPYPSTRFSDFTPQHLEQYETAFSRILNLAVKKFSPDIIHSHHLWLMTALIRKLFPRIKVITSVHGTELRQLQLARKLADQIIAGVSRVDQVLVLNHEQRRRVIADFTFPAERVTVTGTGYRQDLFCRSLCAKEKRTTLIYAGKLSRAKGVFWLLKAFRKIESEAVLWLAGSGDGPEAEEIRAAAAEDSRVRLLGALSQTELAARFQRAHIMVLPSFYEGLPLVLLEALACDCRVVVTDLPGIRELVSPQAVNEGLVTCLPLPPLQGADVLAEENEPLFLENLTKALATQLKNVAEEQFICGHALQQTLNETGWHKIFQRTRKIYAEVNSRRRS
ncbi:MAG: glycosyltransferase family 4 protein [Deltaproteobacteria bacterium]|nr:glycosyltransferase family 4 protein [Deltaproteobacteria bacterium]